MLFDSHCHINFNAYKDDAEEVIRRSLSKGIWLINIGSQLSTSARSIKIAEKYPEGVYAVVGLHPIHLTGDITESATFNGEEYKFVTKQEKFDYNKYKELALSSEKVVGIGEVGLDYYYFGENKLPAEEIKKVQRETLAGFIKLAGELDLPLVLHCRGNKGEPYGAYDDLLGILESRIKNQESRIRGVIHCFGGNMEQAKKFVALGFFVGFTGIVTFKKAVELQAIVKELPLDRILVETDAPFLAPEPHRGTRNEPAFVEFVAEKVAELKGLSLAEVAAETFKNTKELFRLA
ncbi:MAG: TatD family hydrolase [Patescibacteria group bacterium]|jgi:TatD DNase family protein